MSGSSLDGLDIAYCLFTFESECWHYEILHTDVVPYADEWLNRLKDIREISGQLLWENHTLLGHYFGEQVNAFVRKYAHDGQVDLVASHGHTVFHFPEKRTTTQIGDGAAIAAVTGLPVVCDFRSTDIALGGQGTPIVPIGDLLLFHDHSFCLNIGGIANISCKTKGQQSIVAFDICAANQVLNALANRMGFEYDAGGRVARSGALNETLLQQLNRLDFYQADYPKSLDNGYSREIVLPLVDSFDISVEDKLRTYTEHMAMQITKHMYRIYEKEGLLFDDGEKMLVTGGGAFNDFLMERLEALSEVEVVVPNDELVKFKEAVVIALMGILRMRNEVNVLKSVTGARKNSVSGAVYMP